MKKIKNKEENEKKTNQILHPFVIIFFAAIFVMILTYIVPLGRYETKEISYVLNGEQNVTKMVDVNTFRYVLDEDGQRVVYPVPLFGSSSMKELGVMNFVFAGLRGSTQAAGTFGLIPYLIVIGGSFGILMRTGVVEQFILRIVKKTEDYVMIIPPLLFCVFSIFGALFGFTEYIIPLTIIIIPMLIAMDFDAITGILCTYGASQIGVSFNWTVSNTLLTAQSLAGVPIQSGQKIRILLWLIVSFISVVYVTIRAWKIHTGTKQSISYRTDILLRGKIKNIRDRNIPYGVGSRLTVIIVFISFVIMIAKIKLNSYGLFEIAAIFFSMAIMVGVVGAFYHLNGMKFSDIPKAFQSGASDFLGVVIVIGMTQGMVLLLGGIDSTAASILNTILYWASMVLSYLPSVLAAFIMYAFQFIFNFFVPNNAGQAAITIPIMAPLAEVMGIGRQISVIAFQIGTGLSHLIVPTSGCLISILAVAHVNWEEWIKSQWKYILTLFMLGFVILGVCVKINYA